MRPSTGPAPGMAGVGVAGLPARAAGDGRAADATAAPAESAAAATADETGVPGCTAATVEVTGDVPAAGLRGDAATGPRVGCEPATGAAAASRTEGEGPSGTDDGAGCAGDGADGWLPADGVPRRSGTGT
jgi:hypothetical protein